MRDRRFFHCAAALPVLSLVVTLAACANQTANVPSTSTEVALSGPTSDLRRRVDQIKAKYSLSQVWFRLEIPGRPPLQIATSGSAGELRPVASISKSITGIGIALLIQQGKLRLDSTLGNVLSNFFKARGTTLDPSLQDITIERLLTHRAGLQTNYSSDPVNGISSGDVIDNVGGSHNFFDYVAAANGAKSNGSRDFSYSNLSYLMLGLVIEAVSGQDYNTFCQQNIFAPLHITDATIPTMYTLVSPYAGWHLSMMDVLRVWDSFDRSSPGLLSPATLDRTLLGHLGQPNGQSGRLFYTLGVNVLQYPDGRPYVVNHNGIGDFMRREPKNYTFVEKIVPGPTWMIAFNAGRRDIDSTTRRNINVDVRAMVDAIKSQP